jgi:iron complex transport system ATP-binding protein
MIDLKYISFSYKEKKALNDISFTFKKGVIYGLLGPNGAGKSTLLKLLFGFYQPDVGKILLENRNLPDWSRIELAKKIAYVPQDFHLQFDYTVEEILFMGRFPYLEKMRHYRQKDRQIVDEILADFQLEEFRKKLYSHLSGGEKQRISIARAVAQQTDILLLDEAFSNLDLKFHETVMNLLVQFNKKWQKTIILVSHDINLAVEFCQQLLLLKNGRIFMQGTPRECINAKNIKELYDAEMQIINHPKSNKPNVLYKIHET